MAGGSILLLFAAVAISATSATVPPILDEIFKKCSFQSDVNLDKCLINVLEGARAPLRKGIPEWNIPPLEPLEIKSVWTNDKKGDNRLRGEFKNIRVHGLSLYEIQHLRTYPKDNGASVGLLFPRLDVEGMYNVSGSMFVIPIRGDGPFRTNLTSVYTDTKCLFEIIHPSGPKGDARVHLARTKTDFHITDAKIRLENLFGGDLFIGETVNTFLNQHILSLISEISPQLSNEIDKALIKLFNKAAAAIPVEDWQKLGNVPANTSHPHH